MRVGVEHSNPNNVRLHTLSTYRCHIEVRAMQETSDSDIVLAIPMSVNTMILTLFVLSTCMCTCIHMYVYITYPLSQSTIPNSECANTVSNNKRLCGHSLRADVDERSVNMRYAHTSDVTMHSTDMKQPLKWCISTFKRN